MSFVSMARHSLPAYAHGQRSLAIGGVAPGFRRLTIGRILLTTNDRPIAESHECFGARGEMGDFRNLRVWHRAHQLTLDVYGETRLFPKDERYRLTSQLRRAAASVPANIAEGCGRNGDAELARFLTIARGSASELDYLLLLAHDLGYLKPPRYEQLAAEVQGISRMLTNFVDRLRYPIAAPPPLALRPAAVETHGDSPVDGQPIH
jgi:four helix bundle protein